MIEDAELVHQLEIAADNEMLPDPMKRLAGDAADRIEALSARCCVRESHYDDQGFVVCERHGTDSAGGEGQTK
jgi:hypothetical protein